MESNPYPLQNERAKFLTESHQQGRCRECRQVVVPDCKPAYDGAVERNGEACADRIEVVTDGHPTGAHARKDDQQSGNPACPSGMRRLKLQQQLSGGRRGPGPLRAGGCTARSAASGHSHVRPAPHIAATASAVRVRKAGTSGCRRCRISYREFSLSQKLAKKAGILCNFASMLENQYQYELRRPMATRPGGDVWPGRYLQRR